ncbi:AbrB/MazE/SpoVT family DNA-binding domain-containing protein [Pseudoxanthobacter sp. M-2]|uniref:AbrB/MazE/SpoVT family DNA-binding domain-containing protein n=1 Tax=Pseudoxanthobacter sp. M-2 TaxID=3078754 RepID=UPI0038FCF9FC
MGELTITSKGQVTLRKDVLRHLGVGPGDKITFDVLPDGSVALRAVRPKGSITEAFGMFKRPGGISLTIEEIGEAAADGWAGRR